MEMLILKGFVSLNVLSKSHGNLLLTSTKEAMFLPVSVCLLVACFSAGLQKATEGASTICGERTGLSP